MRKKKMCLIGLAVAACLFLEMIPVGMAAPPRKKVAPKDWEGRIRVASLISSAENFFKANGCAWSGAEALNGTDALIWDVRDYAGLEIETSWGVSSSEVAVRQINGYYLNKDCQGIPGVLWNHPREKSDDWQTIRVPDTAVWQVINAVSFPGVSTDIDVRMHSDGYTPKPKIKKKIKKKKKKKKRR
jgi:hypothetical protein